MNQVSLLGANYWLGQMNKLQQITDLHMKDESSHNGIAIWAEPFLRNLFALLNDSSTWLTFVHNYIVEII